MRRTWLACLLLSCGEAEPPSVESLVVSDPPPPIAAVPEPREPESSEGRFILEASGDLVLNSLAMRAVHAYDTDAAGYHALLDGYGRTLADDALTYVNLEMPLVDDHVELDGGWPRSRTERPRRAPVLGASPALAGVLSELGVELVGLANNHALDQGYAGLSETMAALDRAGLVHAGIGASPELAREARIVERSGLRIAFLAATEALNRRADDAPHLDIARLVPEPALLLAIARAREQADVVVVALHWSTDFVREVQPSQRHLAARLIESGADVILGSGPHVLQTIERLSSARGDALVAYSLGNLASGMGRAYRLGERPDTFVHPANVVPEARDGVVLHLEIDARGGALHITGETRLLFTENDWLLMREAAPAHLAVRPLLEIDAAVCAERLETMRGALGTALPSVPSICTH